MSETGVRTRQSFSAEGVSSDLDIGLQVEQMFLAQRDATKGTGMSGVDYLTAKDDLELNLIELIKARQGGGEMKEADPVDEVAAPEVDADAAALAEAERIAAEEAAAAAEARPRDGPEERGGRETGRGGRGPREPRDLRGPPAAAPREGAPQHRGAPPRHLPQRQVRARRPRPQRLRRLRVVDHGHARHGLDRAAHLRQDPLHELQRLQTQI